MKLTAVDIYTENAPEDLEPIRFSLQGSDPRAQYQVRTIVGIDAEEIVQKFSALNFDGAPMFDFSLKPRDVVMRVVLNPRVILGETYSDLRDNLYRQISANRRGGLRLEFRSGATTVCSISGYISKFEVAHFDKLPELQITVHCNDPMFRGITPVEYDAAQLAVINAASLFQVPDTFSTAPHGFVMAVKFVAGSATFTMFDDDVDPQWEFKVQPTSPFLVNDILTISSEFTNKYVYRTRSGVTTGMADAIVPGSIWPLLFPFPARNTFLINERANLDIISLTYFPAYWGV